MAAQKEYENKKKEKKKKKKKKKGFEGYVLTFFDAVENFCKNLKLASLTVQEISRDQAKRHVTQTQRTDARTHEHNILNSARICVACVVLRMSKYASNASASSAASDSFSSYGFDSMMILLACVILHFSKSLLSNGVP